MYHGVCVMYYYFYIKLWIKLFETFFFLFLFKSLYDDLLISLYRLFSLVVAMNSVYNVGLAGTLIPRYQASLDLAE